MRFHPTAIANVTTVDWEPRADERGFFARLHCPEAFADAGFAFAPVQTSLSRNREAGTLRGLHWQAPPFAETKLVRVVRGRSFHVCVDLGRRDWLGFELEPEGGGALLIGPGVAHGFMTREPATDVLYQIAPGHAPAHARGARWDDPAFGIEWPAPPVVISARDLDFPAYAGPPP